LSISEVLSQGRGACGFLEHQQEVERKIFALGVAKYRSVQTDAIAQELPQARAIVVVGTGALKCASIACDFDTYRFRARAVRVPDR
jgi:hypothetical protein